MIRLCFTPSTFHSLIAVTWTCNILPLQRRLHANCLCVNSDDDSAESFANPLCLCIIEKVLFKCQAANYHSLFQDLHTAESKMPSESHHYRRVTKHPERLDSLSSVEKNDDEKAFGIVTKIRSLKSRKSKIKNFQVSSVGAEWHVAFSLGEEHSEAQWRVENAIKCSWTACTLAIPKSSLKSESKLIRLRVFHFRHQVAPA